MGAVSRQQRLPSIYPVNLVLRCNMLIGMRLSALICASAVSRFILLGHY